MLRSLKNEYGQKKFGKTPKVLNIEVENDFFNLLYCPLYQDLRKVLFKKKSILLIYI